MATGVDTKAMPAAAAATLAANDSTPASNGAAAAAPIANSNTAATAAGAGTANDSNSAASTSGATAAAATANGANSATTSSGADDAHSGPTIEEIIEKSLSRANDAKSRGNVHFANKSYASAIDCYSEALALCPPNDVKDMAIFYSNRAACHLALNAFDAVIGDCTASLTLSPGYVRALFRRAKAYEMTGKPYDALQDMNAVLALEPANGDAKSAAARLQIESDKKFESQKDEMLGKLKELGNGLLGKFGMSLDNFKATKDPNTGSYSIAFQNAK